MMRSKISLKNLAALLLTALLFNTTPLYSQEPEVTQEAKITKDIVDIGKKEYNMDLKSWLIGKTLWVYLPIEHLFDEKLQAKNDAVKQIEGARLGIFRVAFNATDKVDFTVFAFCDLNLGYDYFEIMSFLDMKKIWFGYISRGDFRNRVVIKEGLNKEAIDDKEGKHIQPFDIDWKGFLVTQLGQNIRAYFNMDLKDNYNLKEIKIDFTNNVAVQLDYEKTGKKDIPVDDGVLNIIAKAINNYGFDTFTLLEFSDLNTGRKTTFSRKSLLDLIKYP